MHANTRPCAIYSESITITAENVLHRVRMLPITRWLLVLAWSASQAYALDRDQDRTHLVRKERYNLLDTLRSVLKAQ